MWAALKRDDGLGFMAILAAFTSLVIIGPIGKVVGIVLLISVIGWPLYVVMLAIPPLSLALVLVFLGRAAFLALGIGSWVGPFAVVPAVMLGLPALSNIRIEREVASLVAGDRAEPVEPWRGGTLAIVVDSTRSEPCDDFCQRALVSGAVQTFLVARSPRLPEFDASVVGTAYRLERRDRCDPADIRESWRDYPIAPKAPNAALAMRAAVARGDCLVKVPMPLAQADAVLVHSRVGETTLGRADLSPFAMPISAMRASYHRKVGGRFVELWRETSVRHALLYPVLIPTLENVRMDSSKASGLLRTQASAGAPGAPRLDEFVVNSLRLNLTLPDLGAPALIGSIEAAMKRGGPVDSATNGLVEALFKARGSRDEAERAAARAPTLVYLRDHRLAVPANLPEFARGTAADHAALRDAILDRLDAELGAPDSPDRQRDIQRLARAVALFPDRDVPMAWARLLPGRRDVVTAAAFEGMIRRAALVGGTVAADLVTMLDTPPPKTSGRRSDDSITVRRAALAGICGMGRAAADLLPAIETRVRSGAIPSRFREDWRMIANTVAALGGDPGDLLRHAAGAANLTPKMAEDLESVLARAAAKPDCRFY